MTNQQHPITPPPELVDQWWQAILLNHHNGTGFLLQLCIQAAQWGADQELDACKQIAYQRGLPDTAAEFQRIRRPKPPSLKEEVMQIIDCLIEGDCLNDDDAVTMLRVLEVLPND